MHVIVKEAMIAKIHIKLTSTQQQYGSSDNEPGDINQTNTIFSLPDDEQQHYAALLLVLAVLKKP